MDLNFTSSMSFFYKQKKRNLTSFLELTLSSRVQKEQFGEVNMP